MSDFNGMNEMKCMVCDVMFPNFRALDKHAVVHKQSKPNSIRQFHSCFNCCKRFATRSLLRRHLTSNCIDWKIPDISDKLNNDFFHIKRISALGGCVSDYHLKPKRVCVDERIALDEVQEGIEKALVWLIDNKIEVKWAYSMEAAFIKSSADDEIIEHKALFSIDQYANSNTVSWYLPEMLDKMSAEIMRKVDKYTKNGSGWVLTRVSKITLQLSRFCSLLSDSNDAY